MRAVRFQIVDLGKNPAQAADIHRLTAQTPLSHKQSQERQDFLGAAKRESWDENGPLAFEGAFDGARQPFDLALAVEARGERAIATSRFHQEHLGLEAPETCRFQNSLIVKTNVAGIEEGFFLTT